MQLTLTITDSPALPAEALRRFVDMAVRRGKDPSQIISEFIVKSSTPAPAPKRKKEVAR